MTKSYNYTPTHFLYSSLLFFLLIFMHQQIHCHTLPKPFFQIFLFRIYAPTVQTHPHHIDPVFAETGIRFPHIPRQSSPRKPIHNDTVHQISTPIQPPQTNPLTTTDTRTPQTPHPYTHHEFRSNTASTKRTQPRSPTNAHRHPRDAKPPDDVDDAPRSDAIPRR